MTMPSSSPSPSDDDEASTSEDSASSPPSELLDRYNALVSSLFLDYSTIRDVLATAHSNLDSDTEESSGRPLSKAEKQNAKKKRRRERDKMMKAVEVKKVSRKEEEMTSRFSV
jgi:hypothetical protein